LDESKTRLWLDFPQGTDEAIVRIDAALSADAVSAQLNFGDKVIALSQGEGEWWSGNSLTLKRADLEPLVPPTLTVHDAAGNVKIYNLNVSNWQPTETSLTDRYQFIRSHPSSEVKTLFGFSDWLYRTLLFGSVMALCVAVGVEIKKQKPKLIASTTGLIVLLIAFLIF